MYSTLWWTSRRERMDFGQPVFCFCCLKCPRHTIVSFAPSAGPIIFETSLLSAERDPDVTRRQGAVYMRMRILHCVGNERAYLRAGRGSRWRFRGPGPATILCRLSPFPSLSFHVHVPLQIAMTLCVCVCVCLFVSFSCYMLPRTCSRMCQNTVQMR